MIAGAFTAAAQTEIPQVEFKGLRLGLTKHAVDSLIRYTLWDYGGWPQDTAKNQWKLGIDGVWKDNASTVFDCEFASDPDRCAFFSGATIRFDSGVVVLMRVDGGPVVRDSVFSFSVFGSSTTRMIEKVYGPATSSSGSFDNIPFRGGSPFHTWYLPLGSSDPEYTIRVWESGMEVVNMKMDTGYR